jgi:hypothetical protein
MCSLSLILLLAREPLAAQPTSNVSLPTVAFTRAGIITDAATPGEPWVSIGAAQMDRNGGIYVAFPAEHTIRHFASDGRLLRSIGRKGSGPGEFERLAGIGWISDTLWALDRSGRRFTLFSPAGVPLRTQSALGTSHDGYGINPSALLQGGWISYNGSIYADALLAKRPRVTPMVVMQPPDGKPKEYARIATGVLTLAMPGSGTLSGTGRDAQRLTTDGLVRTAPDGSFLVVLNREPKSALATTEFTVTVVAPSGATRVQRTFTVPATRVRKEHIEEFVSGYAEGMRLGPRGRTHFPSDGSARDYLLNQLTLPKIYPPVSGLFISSDHAIWLRGLDLGQASIEWTVLNAKLEPQFRVTLPTEFAPKAASRESMWGTSLDEDDVPYLIHFRRASGGR